MKITNISCSQFAGARNRSVSFTDGINVIYGKNESGKSTIVNLISRTLFQNAKINSNTTKDKDFKNLYFPVAENGSSLVGDFADGEITFETDNGTYTLSKEWGNDPNCKLSTPNGIIKNPIQINEILKEVLLYGEGVYSDMLFSSQYNTNTSLEKFLDPSQKFDAKTELTNIVSQAFAESGGISLASIENAINDKIDNIKGKHWDSVNNKPEPHRERHKKNVGEILKAYYEYEDAKKASEERRNLETKLDEAEKNYNNAKSAKEEAEKKRDDFSGYVSTLEKQNSLNKIIQLQEKKLGNLEGILREWPELTKKLEKAKALQSENDNRESLDKYDKVEKNNDDIAKLKNSIPPFQPTEEDIKQVENSDKNIAKLKNKLCGMNITATINMLSGNNVEITSVLTGEAIDISNGIASISEAVRISVPGVMDMQLSPADVDVSTIETNIADNQRNRDEIFTKYGVETVDELKLLAENAQIVENQVNHAENENKMILGSDTFEELKSKVKAIPTPDSIRSKADINLDIINSCEGKTVDNFITEKETLTKQYTNEYHDISSLEREVDSLNKELKENQIKASKVDDIPPEYSNIDNPETHLNHLKDDYDKKETDLNTALLLKGDAEARLNFYSENSIDLEANEERTKRIYEEWQSSLEHWQHIKEVFDKCKEEIRDNPMQDIAESFTLYLNIISNDKVSTELPDADKFNINIYSDNKLLNYKKLSEGTKETVSLAFRLAVLDHLFPDGGGVIVFDDPLTDMDPERTKQACSLIKECATRHQVIFLTCKEDEYKPLLSGNSIYF